VSFLHSLRLSSLDRNLTIILANHHWYFECTNGLPTMRREIPYLALTEVQLQATSPFASTTLEHDTHEYQNQRYIR
jgi:hypothetical protein